MPATARALLVLGMHRSGTSAMAGLLELLGVELGSNLLPPCPSFNPEGFFEQADLVAVHDRILDVLGSGWDDVCPLPEGWWEQDAIASLRIELASIVRREYGASPLWGFKDPRLCRLLPLWQSVLAELGI